MKIVEVVGCARGPRFLDPICRHGEGITQILTAVAVVAVVVASVGAAAPTVSIGGSTGVAVGTSTSGAAGAAGAGTTTFLSGLPVGASVSGASIVSEKVAIEAAILAAAMHLGPRVPDHERQNKQFADAVRECERRIGRRLSKDEVRYLHDWITGQNFGYHEIVEECTDLFGKR